MIVKALKRTDENATRQPATENTAMKMDETDRETSETDENWQTVTNQRSNKLQKTNTYAPTTAMSFFGQTIPQNPKTGGVHSYFSFGGNDTQSKMLFESGAWLTSICGLEFKATFPSRIPTSNSILVTRVPREWHVDSVRPLIAQRYPSTVQVARIFRDGQPINRIRVDFRSNEDVQKILQCSRISIDSIRYPAVAYTPLARIDRCFRCQQFGHRAVNCSHESKCYKCGENHEYNRDCGNAVKCSNCDGQHMADSPECP